MAKFYSKTLKMCVKINKRKKIAKMMIKGEINKTETVNKH